MSGCWSPRLGWRFCLKWGERERERRVGGGEKGCGWCRLPIQIAKRNQEGVSSAIRSYVVLPVKRFVS